MQLDHIFIVQKNQKNMCFDFTIQAGANELGSRNTKHVISLQMLHTVKTHSHVRSQNIKFFLYCLLFFIIFTGARAYELGFSCEISLFIYIYNEKKRGYLPMSARQKRKTP
jgi:hypothetical protein